MKTRESTSITLEPKTKKIAKELAKTRHTTISRMVEGLITGFIRIDPDEYKQWDLYYTIKEEEK